MKREDGLIGASNHAVCSVTASALRVTVPFSPCDQCHCATADRITMIAKCENEGKVGTR